MFVCLLVVVVVGLTASCGRWKSSADSARVSHNSARHGKDLLLTPFFLLLQIRSGWTVPYENKQTARSLADCFSRQTARSLSDCFPRHRQPPGLWLTVFPDTDSQVYIVDLAATLAVVAATVAFAAVDAAVVFAAVLAAIVLVVVVVAVVDDAVSDVAADNEDNGHDSRSNN